MKRYISKNDEVELLEPVESMATVLSDRNRSLCIVVNPDLNRIGDEYFKVYNNSSKIKASKIARISFRNSRYIVHHINDGKDIWYLNSRERKMLMDCLCSVVSSEDSRLTIYQLAIVAFNRERFDMNKTDSLNNTVDNPNPEFPNALPIDLPMPDYNNLTMK